METSTPEEIIDDIVLQFLLPCKKCSINWALSEGLGRWTHILHLNLKKREELMILSNNLQNLLKRASSRSEIRFVAATTTTTPSSSSFSSCLMISLFSSYFSLKCSSSFWMVVGVDDIDVWSLFLSLNLRLLFLQLIWSGEDELGGEDLFAFLLLSDDSWINNSERSRLAWSIYWWKWVNFKNLW